MAAPEGVPSGGGGPGDLGRRVARRRGPDLGLTAMVVFMAFQAGNARSDRRSVLTVPLRDNPFLVLATAGSFAVHAGALYFPPTQFVLRVEPLDLRAWLQAVAVAAAVLVTVDADKAFRRWTTRSPPVSPAPARPRRRSVGPRARTR